MDGRSYEPASLTVSAGDTISFLNDTEESHTVTAYQDGVPDDGDYFSSGDLASEKAARANLAEALVKPGDTYEVTFEEPGTYDYFCIPHEDEGMKGSITVEG